MFQYEKTIHSGTDNETVIGLAAILFSFNFFDRNCIILFGKDKLSRTQIRRLNVGVFYTHVFVLYPCIIFAGE